MKKRNIIARDTPHRPAGPVRIKKNISRQQEKINVKKESLDN